MNGPLSGIKVVEVANFLAVPSCAALMADMGAEVIKVEPRQGDPFRWLARREEFQVDFPLNYAFELDNRGKRGIALDLNKPEAVEVVCKLVDRADVFVTNLVPRRLERFRLRYEDLSPENPRLIYLAFSGYGPRGPDRDRLGFDHTAFWARSGLMHMISELNDEPLDLQDGMGDHTTSPLLLAGVLAALLERHRTGKGQLVTASLLNMGLWVLGTDVQEALASGRAPHRRRRAEARDAMV
ncbi:MAG: CoA transferase, partial [Chloroflexi bacterium]|nr:CoA transferase [Chloroflexota bacterium]